MGCKDNGKGGYRGLDVKNFGRWNAERRMKIDSWEAKAKSWAKEENVKKSKIFPHLSQNIWRFKGTRYWGKGDK